jgi:hypothetical protein
MNMLGAVFRELLGLGDCGGRRTCRHFCNFDTRRSIGGGSDLAVWLPRSALGERGMQSRFRANLAVGMIGPDDKPRQQIDAALEQMLADGTIARVYARYGIELRPPE